MSKLLRYGITETVEGELKIAVRLSLSFARLKGVHFPWTAASQMYKLVIRTVYG